MRVIGVREIPIDKIEVVQRLLPRVETHMDKVEEYKEAIEFGSEFPPITVWQRGEEFWLIDGMHRLLAIKRLGRKTIKAEIVELRDTLEGKILAIVKNKHGIPLSREERRLLCQNLYMEGVEIPELQRIFGISARTVYNWVQGLKRREKPEELKEKAKELKEQGYSLREIGEKLGVDYTTVSKWINDQSSVENLQKLQIVNTPTPSEEEIEEEIEEPDFYDNNTEEDDEISYDKLIQSATESSSELSNYVRQRFEEEQKRSNGGRPPNDPPATEEELYNELKATLLEYVYKIALKIGWEKTFKLLDEIKERAREVSKSAKRGW